MGDGALYRETSALGMDPACCNSCRYTRKAAGRSF